MDKHVLFRGGVHPDDGKSMSCDCAIKDAPLMETYNVPLQQHIGAPPKPVVKKGDKVLKGQLIAEPGGFVSAAIHAPTSGTVKLFDTCIVPNGAKAPSVVIESDGEDTADTSMEPVANWQDADPDVLKNRIAEAGIVGMGGAAFPAFVKLSPPPAKKIDVLILNGVECEPCLTADHRLMLEEGEKVVKGAQILARILGVKNTYIGIEGNKPDAIIKMRELCSGTDIKVVDLRVRYPQGAEKQLIYAVSGRKVPCGGLPMDVGCVVQNVGTAAAVYEAVAEGKTLYERVTTVTGSPVVNPGNWRFRVGTTVEEALKLSGGVKVNPGKIISGGPMMGMSLFSLAVPIMKNSSGLLLLAPEEVHQYTSEPCIRCGSCVDVCPMSLMPGTISVQAGAERFDLAESWNVMDCIECGSCAYVCPANRPLVQHLRRSKGEVLAKRRAAKK